MADPHAVDIGPYQNITSVGWGGGFMLLALVYERWVDVRTELEVNDIRVSIKTEDNTNADADGKDYIAILASGAWHETGLTDPDHYPFDGDGGSLGTAVNGAGKEAVFDAAGARWINDNPALSSPERDAQIADALAAMNVSGAGSDGTPFDSSGSYYRIANLSSGTYTWSYAHFTEEGTEVLAGDPTSSGSIGVPEDPTYTLYGYRLWNPGGDIEEKPGTWAVAYIDARKIWKVLQTFNDFAFHVEVLIDTGEGAEFHEGEGGSGDADGGVAKGHWTTHSAIAFDQIPDFGSLIDDSINTPDGVLDALRFAVGLRDEGDFDMTVGPPLTGDLFPNTLVTVDQDGPRFQSAL